MMGSILAKLQVYLIERLGQDCWQSILVEAGLPPNKIYHTIQFYPDIELEHIINAACTKLHKPKEALYREIGKDFGKYLIGAYGLMFFPSWKTIDVIDKISPKIYKILQLIDPKTPKSEVRTKRISKNEVLVYYQSPRRMCEFIEGVYVAAGEHFKENIEIKQLQCMHQEAPECEIQIKLVESPATALIKSK